MKRALLSLLLITTAAHASEPQIVGIGARSSALGGTGAADSTGFEATYTNPAGLADDPRRTLSVGYVYGHFDLKLNGLHQPVAATEGLLLGASLPLPFGGILRNRLVVGIGFYLPGNVIATATAPFPDQQRLALLEQQTQTVSILVSVGARINRRITIGIGTLALAALTGAITIRPDAGGHITTLSQQQLVTGFAPVAGVRVIALSWLTLGTSLVGESKAAYDITVTSMLRSVLPIDLPHLRFHGVAQYDPLHVNVEASFTPRSWARVNLGLTYKNWSKFPLPIQNATAGAPPIPKPGYHDTVVPRAGLELTAMTRYVRFDGRIGYLFEWSPAPTGPTRVLLDADRHVLTLGVGARLLKWVGMQVDVFGQLHQLAGSNVASGRFGVVGALLGVDL